MKRPKLTLEQRIDIILEKGVDDPSVFMPVKAYVAPRDGCTYDGWESEHLNLMMHHEKETEFLLSAIKELRQRLITKT